MDGLTQIVFLTAVALAVVGLLMVRRRTLAKMAFRNITRKKRYTVIVVGGLLVSTAMISGSLVVADTMDYLIKQDTYESTGHVDEIVSVKDDAGQPTFFPQGIAYDLISEIDDGNLTAMDGAAPAIRMGVTVIRPVSNTSAPTAQLFAFDPDHVLNPLLGQDGSAVTAEDISAGKAVLNEDIADRLEASPGDTILVITETGVPVPLEVSLIAKDTGLALWQSSELVFVDLGFAQQAIFGEPGMINRLDVSNIGGIEDGYIATDEAVAELEEALPAAYEYDIDSAKKDGIEAAELSSDQISDIFILMSTFAIIAGVALIINIFVMLAEERKPEMGISRAIGMQRGDLTQSFLFEGVVYALLASAVGAFVGLLVAFVMIQLFAAIFGGAAGLTFVLHFEWRSLAIAACAGFLITLLTVTAASWRVSKLNIVRAIRDIPEPMLKKSEKRYLASGTLVAALGALITVGGLTSGQAIQVTIGPCLAVLGIAMVAVRFANPRIPFTLAGVFLIYWVIDPTDFKSLFEDAATAGIEMFVVSGLVLVTGGVLIAMFNSDYMLDGLVRVFGRRKSLLPVFRAAISYPMNKKFRTGLSLFIFSLIMFTVVVIAMIASFQRESVDTVSHKFSGGYEILAFSMRDIPVENLTEGISAINAGMGDTVIEGVEPVTTAPVGLVVEGYNESFGTNLMGFDDDVLDRGGFSLQTRDEAYASDDDVWKAVADDPGLAVIDGSVVQNLYGPQFGRFLLDVGDEVTVVLQDGNISVVRIVGIMDQIFLQGVFTSAAYVSDAAPVTHQNLFYVATAHGSSITDADIAMELENRFVQYGLTTFVIKDAVEEYMSLVSSIMQLMEVFLGIGLVVGIAGLGIITVRNVAERRQEIGVMRAIGFQRRMVLNVFLIETSFVAILGILIGVVLGLALSWRLYDWGGFSENAPFVIPWGEIAMLFAIAFFITQLSTLPPSAKASRLAPAEALRRID